MVCVDVCQDGILQLDFLANCLPIDAQISGSPSWVVQHRNGSLIVTPKVEKDVVSQGLVHHQPKISSNLMARRKCVQLAFRGTLCHLLFLSGLPVDKVSHGPVG